MENKNKTEVRKVRQGVTAEVLNVHKDDVKVGGYVLCTMQQGREILVCESDIKRDFMGLSICNSIKPMRTVKRYHDNYEMRRLPI